MSSATSMLSQYLIPSPCTLSPRAWKEVTGRSGMGGTALDFTSQTHGLSVHWLFIMSGLCQVTELHSQFFTKIIILKDIFFSSLAIWLSYLYSVLFLELYWVYIWSLNRKKIKEQVKVRASPLFPGLKKMSETTVIFFLQSKQETVLYTLQDSPQSHDWSQPHYLLVWMADLLYHSLTAINAQHKSFFNIK